MERGIIIADTKFEFGQDDEGRLYIIDEMLTPDSSRFWPASEYNVGISPPSFDKQFVRDYLDTLDWDKTAPGPTLPPDVLQRTGDKYREALHILTSQRQVSDNIANKLKQSSRFRTQRQCTMTTFAHLRAHIN